MKTTTHPTRRRAGYSPAEYPASSLHGKWRVVEWAPLEHHWKAMGYEFPSVGNTARAIHRARRAGFIAEHIADELLTSVGDNYLMSVWYG